MPPLKLTKSSIDKLQFGGKATDYFDTELKGFGIRVGKESKSFFARKEVKGRPIRKTIGKLGAWTPDQARDAAKELLYQMDRGIDPRAEERRLKVESKTVSEAFSEYMESRGIKENTRENYQRIRDIYLASWSTRAIGSITRQNVLDRHREITATNGPGMANLTMTSFRAVWNVTHAHLEQAPTSPTKALSVARSWNPDVRRTDRLKPAQFPEFFHAIKFMGHAHHDAYILAVHTGLRSEEVAGLLWANVDFSERTFCVMDTKNGTNLILPMSGYIHDLLENRRKLVKSSPYVFAGPGKGGNIVLLAAHLHKLGFNELTVHGLRRTFRSICERLAVPTATIKRLMNHSLMVDITDSYLNLEIEELRPWVEKISGEVQALSGQ